MKHEIRHGIEKAIVNQIVKVALGLGYAVNVNDGEETVLRKSIDQTAIVDAMFSTDEDVLTFFTSDGNKVGFILFIYGNTGWDVIADHSDAPAINTLVRIGADPLVAKVEDMCSTGREDQILEEISKI